jgi:uncharacterized membrane protein YfcA
MFDFLLVDHSVGALVALAASAFAAALARGFSGFGGALIFVPLASTAIGPRAAAPLLLMIDAVAAAGLISNARRHSDKPDVGTMALGAVVGVPLGAIVLANTNPLVIRWAIVSVVVLLLLLLVSGWRYQGRPTAPLTIGVGAWAGLFSGTAQVGGPPVVAYWLSRALPAEVVRANIVLYFAISTVFSLVSYLASGLLTPSVLGLAIVAGPSYGLGLYLGIRVFRLAGGSTFRWICHGLIAAAAVLSLPALDGLLRW